MTVESNYAIVIATLGDWFKNLAPVYQPLRGKPIFPALLATCMELLRIWIGSLHCLQLL